MADFYFIEEAANQPTIMGVVLCHTKLQRPLFFSFNTCILHLLLFSL